jgi:hypothetical protein
VNVHEGIRYGQEQLAYLKELRDVLVEVVIVIRQVFGHELP